MTRALRPRLPRRTSRCLPLRPSAPGRSDILSRPGRGSGGLASLPCAAVRHRSPRFGGRERGAPLQELDRNLVGRADEGHPSVARRPIDGHAIVHQPPAGLVDVVHLVSEVAEVAAAAVAGLIPVMGKLDLAAFVAGNAKEDEREPPLLILHPPALLEAEELKEY